MHPKTVVGLTSSTLATIYSINTLTAASSSSSNSTEQPPEGSFSATPDGTFVSHISADYRSMAESQGGASEVSYFENTPTQEQGRSRQVEEKEKGESKAAEGKK
jgi:hypothetical protein